MSEPMTPDVADAIAGIHAAGLKRSYDKGFSDGFDVAFKRGIEHGKAQLLAAQQAAAQQPQPEQPAQPSQIILVDEGGIEIVRDLMEHPDG